MAVLLATHDLPYAYELCARAVIMDEGVVVADGPTDELLSDDALLAAHRLELPGGFCVEVARERDALGAPK